MTAQLETVTATCEFDLEWNGYWGDAPSGIACAEPSFATVSLACVHEHIDTPPACAGCCAEVQQCTGILTCPRCEDGPEPHECLCDVRITWLDGTVTVVQTAVALWD